MWKYLFILLIIFSGAGTLAAQPGNEDASRFEQIRAAKEAFFREELLLSDTEAEKFFPVYWQYERRMRRARREMGGRRGKQAVPDLTEAEAKAQLLANREQRRQSMEVHEEAEEAYLKVLPATKVIRLHELERDFREKLLRRLKQSSGN